MSKISDYQKQVHSKNAEATTKADQQSVSEFALELRKETDTLLLQLQHAGIAKVSGSDTLTNADKAALLSYLQSQHCSKEPRKKITVSIESEEQVLMRRAVKKENGAEFEALRHFAATVLFGNPVDPTFQKVVNLILAKAVFIGALPLERLGRPKGDEGDSIGLEAAHRYWGLIDSGVGYDQAVATLGEEFHKSERHLMRLISTHKRAIGDTPEIRAKNRIQNEMLLRLGPVNLDHYVKVFEPNMQVPELDLDDCLEHLEKLISELAADVKPLTRKI